MPTDAQGDEAYGARQGPAGRGAEGVDALNRELLLRLQESGEAVPSGTLVQGAFALRVALTNHRTRTPDLDRLVEAVARIGDALVAEARVAAGGA